MTGEIIKSFLVGLGFDVDDSSLTKFNKSIASAAIKVTALYASIKLAAAGIAAGIAGISSDFEQMGYEYHIIAPAINKALVLRNDLLNAYKAAGVNIVSVIQNSIRLNMSLAKTKNAFDAIYKSVASRFFVLLTNQSDTLRKNLYANMPKIQAALERFVKFVFKAFEVVTELGKRVWSILSRVYDFFVTLDKATDGWSTIILGVIAAWKLLNLEFLATPLGMIIAGLVAILALFDDFKTWQEGGKSLFDWTSFVPVITTVTDTLKVLYQVLDDIAQVIGNVVLAMYQAFHGDWTGVIDSLKQAFQSLLTTVEDLFTALGGIGSSLGALGGWAMKLFGGDGGANVAANLQNNPTTQPMTTPLGANVQNSNTNQHVNQQTQITVMGGADANAVGKSVAGEQNRVNFDMTRNLKGATR